MDPAIVNHKSVFSLHANSIFTGSLPARNVIVILLRYDNRRFPNHGTEVKKTYMRVDVWKKVLLSVAALPVLWCRLQAQALSGNSQSLDRNMGTVTGTVYDSQSGRVVRSAQVKIVGADHTVFTDLDGRFALQIPIGIHNLVVSMEGYFDQPLDGVMIEAGKAVYIDPILVPKNLLTGEKVVVTADTVQAATFRSVLLERQLSEAISDAISAEDIRKNPDSDAAAVLERVTGVSVVEDKFVYVRGLGERYSSTQVNGSMVPSTDPEKKVVAFDLFPAALINKISTLKSFTPDQPGDFSGALVKVDTVEFPAEFLFKYSAQVGYNSNVTGKSILGYKGSGMDWLGFGYKSRKIPSAFPAARITKKNDLTGSGFSPQQLQSLGQGLKNEWEAVREKADPDLSQSITIGGTKGRLGGIFSATGSRKFSHIEESVHSYQPSNGDLVPWNTFTNDRSVETVKSSLVGNLCYKLGRDHKLMWKTFYTRDSSDETRLLYGYSSGNSADERDTRLRYLEEKLITSQLAGDHYFPALANSLVQWRMAYSQAGRGEPDMREVIYRSEQGKNDYFFSPEGQSGFRQFSDQQDRIYEPGADWSMSLMRKGMQINLKTGGLYQHRGRDFSSRRFVFQILDRSIDLRQGPEQLFHSDNIAPDRIELREITRFTDNFDAGQSISAGYAMADFLLNPQWRLLGGVRYEDSRIWLNTFDPYTPSLTPQKTRLNNRDLLPAASVVYSLTRAMNLRTSYSRTLNRPEFREMAPFQFTDISGRSTILGNPNLKQSSIHNYDLRWEWYADGQDLYSAGVFLKRFHKPIERVLYYAADLLTSYANISRASNHGIELEARKGIGFLSSRLERFRLYGNYSRVRSEVVIGDISGLVMTSRKRPLQGQADHLLNLQLEYAHPGTNTDFRILYNLIGRRITEVGSNLLPDVYEQPNHFLDLSIGQRFRSLPRMQFKLSLQNILNRYMHELQGDRLYNGYRSGRSVGIGITYDLY